MPTKKKATSRRQLIEATKGDKRYVRRNAKGEFNKVVDVGKSLSSDKRTTAKKKVPKGQGDRGDTKRPQLVKRLLPGDGCIDLCRASRRKGIASILSAFTTTAQTMKLPKRLQPSSGTISAVSMSYTASPSG